MSRIFLMCIALFVVSACSFDDDVACGIPLYANSYYDNANINKDYPCIIDSCGERVCSTYEDTKAEYSNYYTSEPCEQK